MEKLWEETDHIIARALNERLDKKKSKFNTDSTDDISSSGAEFARFQHRSLTSSSEYIDNFDDNMMPPINSAQGIMTDSQGLIVPKKLINPCLESMDRQNLHKELMFNQKVGKSVLNQKTELQKALEKQKERQVLAAQNLAKQQQPEPGFNGELGRVIMQRAQRLEQKSTNQQNDINNHSINPEYLNARAKLRATIDTK